MTPLYRILVFSVPVIGGALMSLPENALAGHYDRHDMRRAYVAGAVGEHRREYYRDRRDDYFDRHDYYRDRERRHALGAAAVGVAAGVAIGAAVANSNE